MKTRKQVYHLTLDDLETTPVWEFALDEEGEAGQDEATVRPFEGASPLDPADGMFVVRARFQLADGTLFAGYLYPPQDMELSLPAVQPNIVTAEGQVMFWFGVIAPPPHVLTASYAKLRRQPDHVFPVSYESDVPIIGGSVRGTLTGFGHYRSFDDQTVVYLL